MSPRPKRLRRILNTPSMKGFKPYGVANTTISPEPVFLLYEEYESIRLCDFELLNHYDASVTMGVSRPTLTRIYAGARQKIAAAFVNARQIVIESGKIYFDSAWFYCKNCACFFTNPHNDKSIENCALCGKPEIKNYAEGFENERKTFRHCKEICICPKCGHEQEHTHGEPCRNIICPFCNEHMIKK